MCVCACKCRTPSWALDISVLLARVPGRSKALQSVQCQRPKHSKSKPVFHCVDCFNMKSRRSTANSFPPAPLKQYIGEQDEVKMSVPQMAASCPDFPKTELPQHTWCLYTVQLLKDINEIDLICLVPQWAHESSCICNVLNPIFVSDRKRDLFFSPIVIIRFMCLLKPGEGTKHDCQHVHQASPVQDRLVVHYCDTTLY